MWLSKKLQEIIRTITQEDATISTEKYLHNHGVKKDGIRQIDDEKITSTEAYLRGNGINQNSLVVETLETTREKHLLKSKTIVLWSLVAPMSIIPVWLMVLLTLPGFGRTQMSEKVQLAILSAIATDYLGLYYVVTRNLFPASETCTCKKNEDKDEQEKQKKVNQEFSSKR